MKKILSLMIVAMLVCAAAMSQSTFSGTATNPTNAITNSSTDTLNLSTNYTYFNGAIQVSVTKTSGTNAGTATLYQSVDGVNYVAYGSAFTITNVTTSSTIWNVTSPSRYWRIIVGGATTVTATAVGKAQFTRN